MNQREEPGVVVVTYNSAGVLAPCLESALRYCRNVVVVDNSPGPETAEVARRFPAVRLLANTGNKGFAGGANEGVRALSTDLILLLNPDARLDSNLEPMVARMARDPQLGALGGRLLNEDGSDQRGFAVRRFPTAASLVLEALGINRLWPGNPVNRRYRAADVDLAVANPDVEQPAGAFLMFRRSVWQALAGFDEGFFPLWFEDVDFLKRVRAAGRRVGYEPGARAIHTGAHSVQDLQPSERQRFWYGNLFKYASRHLAADYQIRLVAAAVLIGAGIRAAVFWGDRPATGVAGLAWTYLVRGRLAAGINYRKAT